jgi:hypothetical protein
VLGVAPGSVGVTGARVDPGSVGAENDPLEAPEDAGVAEGSTDWDCGAAAEGVAGAVVERQPAAMAPIATRPRRMRVLDATRRGVGTVVFVKRS